MSRALQALFLPCFLVFLKNRIISLGFNTCFPFLFLTVTHSVFLFLGCQGQPGEGPVWFGRHIWWGSKGRGSDQHRGQWGHRQGSGVDLWYDISATAPWSDYFTNVLLINLIQQHIDAGPFADVNIIENECTDKTLEVTFTVLCAVFIKLSHCIFSPSLGNLFCFFNGNQWSICFSSSVTSVSRRFYACFVQWIKLQNKFIWNYM